MLYVDGRGLGASFQFWRARCIIAAEKGVFVASDKPAIHEVDFCAQIASSVNVEVSRNPGIFPFHEARVEGYGTGASRRKRKDLRFYDAQGRLVLCGEVKLPGTPEGRSPYDGKLCQDAAQKANDAGVQYFFTWNVNAFVLWDNSLWDRPLQDRRIREWRLQRNLSNPEDVARETNLDFIKSHFLPELLRDLADIISGRRSDWSMPPDDIFIRSLESHLDWPVRLCSTHILEQAKRNRTFDLRIQEWMTEQDWTFVRSPEEEWAKALDNMAKTLAYVWANRLIFYKALRARFSDLPRLELRSSVKKASEAMTVFNRFFQRAVDRSGDYEPLLMPDAKDWATELVFRAENALDAWRGLLRGIESVDFRDVPSDVVGRIFQKLIGPDERHRYGQHFTGDDVVDLINAFCIRSAAAAVLDPACGSGSFLVRAYYRKQHLGLRTHLDLIAELFGCDISMYPAHLATLNLAAREINDEANYPRVARRNFFDYVPSQPFCYVPDNAGGRQAIALPPLDAVVGNPPYVRQEKVEKDDKKRFGQIGAVAWPGLRLTGRSDLHCYFWPAVARLLKTDGYFGFLTSSSWLDVEYGFALQGWILRHFRILAILESAAESWFEDARVKTCVTILQRCDDETQRMTNRVRFVRISSKLSEMIGVPPTPENEEARQTAFENLRDRILSADVDCQGEHWRIIVKTQQELWNDGVRAGMILGNAQATESEDESAEDREDEGEAESKSKGSLEGILDNYRAGKWGRYVRAPNLYFDIMRRFASRFVALGEIADIRFGVKSGCDAFFMPKDITAKMLGQHRTDRAFRQHAGGAPRNDVESGKLKIIEAGDGSVHPIEAEYLAPEVHSLMKVDRPCVRATDVDRIVLLVNEELKDLKAKAPWVWHYLRYGSTASFASEKSKGKPVPERPTCKARDPWYDLTGLVKPGFAFWAKAQQYRHIVPANPERVICNCNLYDVESDELTDSEEKSLVAILNSTIIGLFKTFYGRFAGTEGNLKTEVVDVNLLEVPDPRGVSPRVAKRLSEALDLLCQRDVGRLVEEQLMDCHTPERARRIAAGPLALSNELQQSDRRRLDDAVFEMLGVSDPKEREKLIDRLYEATARHFRDIRVVEIDKMEQRAKSDRGRFSVHDLAADIWDAAELEDVMPMAEWIGKQPESDSTATLLEDRPACLSNDLMFAPSTVYFGKTRKIYRDYRSREQAELAVFLANLGITGELRLPANPESCQKLLERLNARLEKVRARYQELAASRTSDARMRANLEEVLERWFLLGREGPAHGTPMDAELETRETGAEILPFRKVQPHLEERYRTCIPLSTLRAAAGKWSAEQTRLEFDENTEWVTFATTTRFEPGMFVAQIQGDSMEPEIQSGSYCLFRTPRAGTRQGRKLLVWHSGIDDPHTSGHYTLKVYSSEKATAPDGTWHHTRVTLKPLNHNYAPIILTPHDEDEVRVIAEFVGVIGKPGATG
jgi:methylase of polypeptide subunit release factors/SOS-response transcriptional repressor LexA